MSNLSIPLTINSAGSLQTAPANEDQIKNRLKFFLLSGIKKHVSLPTPGIELFWSILMNIGTSSKFMSTGVISIETRKDIETNILKEVNDWLSSQTEVKKVELVGDDFNSNGIKFYTSNYEYLFTFIFARQGRNIITPTIGNWYIQEQINVRN